MGSKKGDKSASINRQQEWERQQRIRGGTDQIDGLFNSQFNDDFFSGRKKAALDYYNPQLQDQYGDAQKQLTFWLARTGNMDSSARADKEGELTKLYDQRTREVADKALAYETSARSDVEGARADLISTLNATGDAEGAVNSATQRSKALTAKPEFDEVGALFEKFTQALGVQAAAERTASLSEGSYSSPYNTGLFGVKGAVKNTK